MVSRLIAGLFLSKGERTFLDIRQVFAGGVLFALKNDGLFVSEPADGCAELDAEYLGGSQPPATIDDLETSPAIGNWTDEAGTICPLSRIESTISAIACGVVGAVKPIRDGRRQDFVRIKLNDLFAVFEQLVSQIASLLHLPDASGDL